MYDCRLFDHPLVIRTNGNITEPLGKMMLDESIADTGVTSEITGSCWNNEALTFFVRDMSNQVFRLEGIELVGRDQVGHACSHTLTYPLSFPLPGRMLDLVRSALLYLGRAASDALSFCAGWCRSIASDLTEITVWCCR